jgi:hypothetical protein
VTSQDPKRLSERPHLQTSESKPQQQSSEQRHSKGDAQERVSENGLLAKSKKQSTPRTPNLFPSWKSSASDGGMPFSDQLKDVEQDAETRLNTWEWRHATFFNRVKEAVARKWKPNQAIRRNDPAGQLVGTQDRVTQVMASIDRDGKLVAIKVSRDSGVFFLDDEALRAFREAAPFSNPPKALFGSNETFEFPFGFMLSYDRGFKFDLNWKPY